MDVDGIAKYSGWTIASRQKRAETIAQKQDAALFDDAADRVVAALDLDERAAAGALLTACDAVLQADAAQKPALRLARTDAERVLKWTRRVRDAPAAAKATERVLLDAATAVVTAGEADRAGPRLFYEELESSWKKPRVSRSVLRQCRTSRSTRSPRQSLAVAPQSQSLRGRRERSPKTQAENIAISGASSAPPTRSRRLATTRRPPWQCLSSSSPRKTSSTLSKPTLKLPCARSATRASATRCGRVPMIYYSTFGARVHVLARPRTLVRVAGGDAEAARRS